MEYTNKIIKGDCKEVLKSIPDGVVRCCVTSPPYFALRDYGTATWIGGDVSCSHEGVPFRTKENINKNAGTGNDIKNKEDKQFYKKICARCGAERIDQQIGLEDTPDKYIENLVSVFREVKRTLSNDGTLWVNIGDSYNSASSNQNSRKEFGSTINNAGYYTNGDSELGRKKIQAQYKPKDLIGIPWMLAFALRADGWYLRQDIIWHKPNPMPESVTDRCTKSHEYIFLLSKSSDYYYDYEAIKTVLAASSVKRPSQDIDSQVGSNRVPGKSNGAMKAIGGVRSRGHKLPHAGFNEKWDKMTLKEQQENGANKRSVWTVATKPYKEAHFATFPPELIIDCIKAGSVEGDIVLDPFSGAGTTAMVAAKLNRNYCGIELNQKYIDITNKRLHKELGLFGAPS